MKIIISHVYSNDNKGDAALLSVLLSDISRVFEKSQITILTLDKVGKNETFEGFPVKNSFMHYARDRYQGRISRFFYASFVGTVTLLWAFVYRYFNVNIYMPKDLRDIITLYQEADLVIPVGGGYIRSKPGFLATVTLFFIIHPFIFAHILRKPTINYSQSVGPFGNKIQEFIAKFAVKRINGIVVREGVSLQLLKKWGINKNVFSSVDSGFSFVSSSTKNIRNELKISRERPVIGITVRNWFKTKEQFNYEKTIAKFADYAIKKYNTFVVFIPQVTVEHHGDDDRESGRRIYGFMEHKNDAYVITENCDHYIIKAIYGNLDYLVGTRFHSVIFAITSNVPSIAIAYEHKTQGIMRDLGLEQWVIDIEKIQIEQLINLFDNLVVDREKYINHLKKVLPPYIEKSQNSIYFVKNVFDKFISENKKSDSQVLSGLL